MKRTIQSLLVVGALAVLAGGCTDRDERGAAERAGEDVGETLDRTGEEVGEAVDRTGDRAERGAEGVVRDVRDEDEPGEPRRDVAGEPGA